MDAYLAAGIASRWAAETGTHLATIAPSRVFEIPNADTDDPEQRAAFDEARRCRARPASGSLGAMMRELTAQGSAPA